MNNTFDSSGLSLDELNDVFAGKSPAIASVGATMDAEDYKGSPSRGATETAALHQQAETGTTAYSDIDNAVARGAATFSANTGLAKTVDRFMANNAQELAQGIRKTFGGTIDLARPDVDESHIDYMVDAMGANGWGGLLKKSLGAWASGAKALRGKDNLIDEWERTEGYKYDDPYQHKMAKLEWAKELASGIVGQREEAKINAKAELDGRDSSWMADIGTDVIEQGGYTFGYIAGTLLPGGKLTTYGVPLALATMQRASDLEGDKLAVGEDGKVRVDKAGDSMGTAFKKGAIGAAGEVAIEEIGGAITAKGAKALLGKTIGRIPVFKKVGGKLMQTKVGRSLDKYWRTMTNLGHMTGVQSFPEEYIEEAEQSLLDAALGVTRRDSELEGTTAMGRISEDMGEFFSADDQKNLVRSLLVMQVLQGGGAKIKDVYDSKYATFAKETKTKEKADVLVKDKEGHEKYVEFVRGIDGLLRDEAGVDEKELKYYTFQEKADALEAWVNGLSEVKAKGFLDDSAEYANRVLKMMNGNGRYDVSKANPDLAAKDKVTLEKDFSAPQPAKDDLGRDVMRRVARIGNYTLTMDMWKDLSGTAGYSIKDNYNRTLSASDANEAATKANEMLAEAKDNNAKLKAINTMRTRVGSNAIVVTGPTFAAIKNRVAQVAEAKGWSAEDLAGVTGAINQGIANSNGDTRGEAFSTTIKGQPYIFVPTSSINNMDDVSRLFVHEGAMHGGFQALFSGEEGEKNKAEFVNLMKGSDMIRAGIAEQAEPGEYRKGDNLVQGNASEVGPTVPGAERDIDFERAADEATAYSQERNFAGASPMDKATKFLRDTWRKGFKYELPLNERELRVYAEEMRKAFDKAGSDGKTYVGYDGKYEQSAQAAQQKAIDKIKRREYAVGLMEGMRDKSGQLALPYKLRSREWAAQKVIVPQPTAEQLQGAMQRNFQESWKRDPGALLAALNEGGKNGETILAEMRDSVRVTDNKVQEQTKKIETNAKDGELQKFKDLNAWMGEMSQSKDGTDVAMVGSKVRSQLWDRYEELKKSGFELDNWETGDDGTRTVTFKDKDGKTEIARITPTGMSVKFGADKQAEQDNTKKVPLAKIRSEYKRIVTEMVDAISNGNKEDIAKTEQEMLELAKDAVNSGVSFASDKTLQKILDDVVASGRIGNKADMLKERLLRLSGWVDDQNLANNVNAPRWSKSRPRGEQKRYGVEYPSATREELDAVIKSMPGVRWSMGKKAREDVKALILRKRPDIFVTRDTSRSLNDVLLGDDDPVVDRNIEEVNKIVDGIVDEIGKFSTPKEQKAALHWFIKGAIRLPEDAPKVTEAIKYGNESPKRIAGYREIIANFDKTMAAAKENLAAQTDPVKIERAQQRIANAQYRYDEAVEKLPKAEGKSFEPLDYDSPMAMIEALHEFKPREKPIDPDTVPQLSDKRDMGNGVVTYLVQDDREGQQAMRQIINTHWGEDANPWCLLQGDGHGNLSDGSNGAYDAWYHWNHYNALPKRVAFKDGKLLAFMATDKQDTESEFPEDAYLSWLDEHGFVEGDERAPSYDYWYDSYWQDGEDNIPEQWWDRKDASHEGIPLGNMPVPNDKFGRWADFEIRDGELYMTGWNDPYHKGEKGNVGYISWHSNGNKKIEITKDGKYQWDSNGSLYSFEKTEGGYVEFEMDGTISDISGITEDEAERIYRENSQKPVRWSKVVNKHTIAELNSDEHVRAYRAMQLRNGKLYPPMAAKVDGKWQDPTELNVWYMSDPRPDLAYLNEKGEFVFKLNKGNGKTIEARYNPYFHSSLSPLNDQFSSAESRPELVVVEVELSKRDLDSGFRAEMAKDSVGTIEWHSGPISSKMRTPRLVNLSRYCRVLRVVPDAEVAKKIYDHLSADNNGNGPELMIPRNTVTPSVAKELESLGVVVASEHAPSKSIGINIDAKTIKATNGKTFWQAIKDGDKTIETRTVAISGVKEGDRVAILDNADGKYRVVGSAVVDKIYDYTTKRGKALFMKHKDKHLVDLETPKNYGYKLTDLRIVENGPVVDNGNSVDFRQGKHLNADVMKNTRWSIIGKRGADRIGLGGRDEAIQMEKDGKSREEIWRTTGWWKGPDDRWRVEVDVDLDSAREFMDYIRKNAGKKKAVTLNEAMPHMSPSAQADWRMISEAYPDMGNFKFRRYAKSGEGGHAGANEVVISPSWDAKWKDTDNGYGSELSLLHEVQHKIQHWEGLGRGSWFTRTNMPKNPVAKAAAKEAIALASPDIVNKPRYWDYYLHSWIGMDGNTEVKYRENNSRTQTNSVQPTDKSDEEWGRYIKKRNRVTAAFDNLEGIAQKYGYKNRSEMLDAIVRDLNAATEYDAATGEVESRLVEVRAMHSAKWRWNTPPWKNFDVLEEDQRSREVKNEPKSLPGMKSIPSVGGAGIANAVRWSKKRAPELIKNGDAMYYKTRTVDQNFMRMLTKSAADMLRMRDYLDKHEKALNLPKDIEGNTLFDNGSYNKSEEPTSICERTIPFEIVLDYTAKILKRPLTQMECMYVNQHMGDIMEEPSCFYCYLALDRELRRETFGRYLDARDAMFKKFDEGMGIKKAYKFYVDNFTSANKINDVKKARVDMWYDLWKSGSQRLSPEDLATDKNIDKARAVSDSMRRQVEDAEEYNRGTSKAKKMIPYRAYDGHLLEMSQKTVDDLNSHYGLRFYSFSDGSPAFVLEDMERIRDASIRGLKGLAYTKMLWWVDMFAPTGININVSVKGTPDGKGGYMCDGMYGTDWEGAKKRRSEFRNVGITYVAMTDDETRWALDQDWVDTVIPFHTVFTPDRLPKYMRWDNHKMDSSDVKGKGWKKGDATSVYPPEHKNLVAEYFKQLKEKNLEPRLATFLDCPNYMKLVNETRLSVDESMPLVPDFNTAAAYPALEKFERRGGYGRLAGYDSKFYKGFARNLAKGIKAGEQPKPDPRYVIDEKTGKKTVMWSKLYKVHPFGLVVNNSKKLNEKPIQVMAGSEDEAIAKARVILSKRYPRQHVSSEYIIEPDDQENGIISANDTKGNKTEGAKPLPGMRAAAGDSVVRKGDGSVRADADAAGDGNGRSVLGDGQGSGETLDVEESFTELVNSGYPNEVADRLVRNGYRSPSWSKRRLVTPEEDAAYADAVKRGDKETALKMIREAAAKAMPNAIKGDDGLPLVFFNGSHGGMRGTTVNAAMWFSSDKFIAEGYTKGDFSGDGDQDVVGENVTPAFISQDDFLEIDAKYREWNDLGMTKQDGEIFENGDIEESEIDEDYADRINTTDEVANYAKGNSYNGLVLRNVVDGHDGGHYTTSTIVAILPTENAFVVDTDNITGLVKSADITYDDAGNLIPLSQRFNQENPDIRWSKSDRTVRLAPNGRRSNLTDKQYDQVRTPEFKAWFGDWENDPANASKVVDENGEPLVVWHGANPTIPPNDTVFTVFNTKPRQYKLNVGSHFGTKDAALDRATNFGAYDLDQGECRTRPFFLNLKNVAEFSDVFGQNNELFALELWSQAFSDIKNEKASRAIMDKIESMYPYLRGAKTVQEADVRYGNYTTGGNTSEGDKRLNGLANSFLDAAGYDGIKYWNDIEGEGWSWVARNPTQIKSATDNSGAFDAENPDIRFSKSKFRVNPFAQQMADFLKDPSDAIEHANSRASRMERNAIAKWMNRYGNKNPTEAGFSTSVGLASTLSPKAIKEVFSDKAGMKAFFTRFREKVQDADLILKRLDELLGVTDKERSAYYQRDRNYGMIEKYKDEFDRELYQPLVEAVAKLRKEYGDNAYDELKYVLLALHGKERNRMIAERGATVKKLLGSDRMPIAMKEAIWAYINGTADSFQTVLTQMAEMSDVFTAQDRANLERELKGSGASTAAWEAGLADLERRGFITRNADGTVIGGKAKAAIDLMRQITQRTRDMLVRSGRLSQAQADLWERLSPNYVPMRDNPDAEFSWLQKFFWGSQGDEPAYTKSYKNTEFRHAMGRSTIADDPIHFAIQQWQNAVSRSMDNVARRVLADELRTSTKASDVGVVFWMPDERKKRELFAKVNGGTATVDEQREYDEMQNAYGALPMRRIIDGTGIVREVPDVQAIERDYPNIVAFKENGDLKFIRFGGFDVMDVTNNGKLSDSDANRIGAAVKKSYANDLWSGWGKIRKATAWFSMMRTAYSPTFVMTNFLADRMQGYRNIYADFGGEGMREFTKWQLKAFNAARMVITGQFDNSEEGRMAKEWFDNGGKIGGMATSTFTEIEKNFMRDLHDLEVKAKGFKSVKNLMTWLRSGSKTVENLNELVEMSTRIAAYATAKKMTGSVADAISYSRDITVNFNRKGEWTPIMNSLFAFSNASIQDLHRTGLSLVARHGMGMVLGTAILGWILSALGYGQDDPEEEKQGKEQYKFRREYMKQNQIGLRLGDHVWSVPLRGAMRLPFYLGAKIQEVMFGKSGIGEAAANVAKLAVDSATDVIGATESPLQSVTPSVARPFVEMAENKTFNGSKIWRDPMNERQVRSNMGRGNTGAVWKGVARAINAITGGNDGKRGMVDFQPEFYQHIVNSVAGSLGRDLGQAASFVTDVANTAIEGKNRMNVRNTPFLSRVASNLGENSAKYHEIENDYRAKLQEFNSLTKAEQEEYGNEVPFLSRRNRLWANDLSDLAKVTQHLMKEEMKETDVDKREALHQLRLRTQYLFIQRMQTNPKEDTAENRRYEKRSAAEADRVARRHKAEAERKAKMAKRGVPFMPR